MTTNKTSDQFPNGFESWAETYWEVVAFIMDKLNWMDAIKNKESPVVEAQLSGGRGALYELAKQWTNEFETLHKGRQWDGEWIDEINKFLNEHK